MTSHAAVVARGMGECCVSGCGDIAMDEENKKFTLAGKEFHEGDFISIDGTTGNIYDGIIPTVDATIAGEFGRIMGWADKFRTMKVRTNADTPADAKKARELGAEGIGLCRTEHMFFEEDRIAAFREMICSDTVEEREAALEKILPYQQGDFEALYEALEGNPVTIRFLDPPLHEFVPTEEADIEKLAKAQGKSVETIKNIIASLHEFNPMMGHRGCRLAVTYPEIAKMQTKAVIRAAINVQKKHADWTVKPEIMIPLVCEVKELKYVKDVVVETADAEIAAAGIKLEYEVLQRLFAGFTAPPEHSFRINVNAMMNDRVHACPLRRTQNGIRVALVHRDDNRRIGSDNFLQRDFTRTVLLMLAKPIFSDIFAAGQVNPVLV